MNINTDYLKKTSDEEIKLTLIHEVVHIIMRQSQERLETMDTITQRILERDTDKIARWIQKLIVDTGGPKK
jgi:predicted SprT family Zn-dependent metalloprotease